MASLRRSKVDVAAEEQENLVTDVMADTNNILKAMKITPNASLLHCRTMEMAGLPQNRRKTVSGEAKINELMKEFAADTDLKPHMKDIAPMVPRIIKALTKVSGERKSQHDKNPKRRREKQSWQALQHS